MHGLHATQPDIIEFIVRQVQRLVRLYRTDGATAFASSRRGRPANDRIDEETRCKAITILIRCHYSDLGPTLATEKLAERHHCSRLLKRYRQSGPLDEHYILSANTTLILARL